MITVIGMRDRHPAGAVLVNTTSRSNGWSRGLSPFVLGPCELWGGHVALNVENAWQYSKVYSQHVRLVPKANVIDSLAMDLEVVMEQWLPWAKAGWANPRAVRYPMGKGGPPPYFSYWDGWRLPYVAARREIYLPLYWRAAEGTMAFRKLVELARSVPHVALVDFDGYDWRAAGMPSLESVIECEGRKMGHAFVLAMMLKSMGIE